jgi:HEAT repeat protein
MLKNQLNTIRQKLERAKKRDAARDVFGANSHKYQLNAPLSVEKLHAFERKHGIVLPEGYAMFLTELGNGGAGPYYGLYALGEEQAIELDLIGEPYKPFLMEENAQSTDCEGSATDETESYPGLINIGTQGCSYEMMLVVTGEHRGKVLYINMDDGQSFMTYEEHFLDWYERWLDETIANYEDAWFGMSRGGNDLELTALYRSATDEKTRSEALQGMLKLPHLAEESVIFLIREFSVCSGEVRRNAFRVLTKLCPSQAEGLVRELLHSPDEEDRLTAMKCLTWYMAQEKHRFKDELLALLHHENNPESFRFLTMLLSDMGQPMLSLMVPFFTHSNSEIRQQALFKAGGAAGEEKAQVMDSFIEALEDPVMMVRLSALQALNGIQETRLLHVFEGLLQKHKTNKEYVRSNISSLLQTFVFHSLAHMEQEVPESLTQVRGLLRKQLGSL